MKQKGLFNMWLVSSFEEKLFELYFGKTRRELPETLRATAHFFLLKKAKQTNKAQVVYILKLTMSEFKDR